MASIIYCLLSVLILTSQLSGMEAKLVKYENEDFATSISAVKHEVHVVYMGAVSETTTTNYEDAHMGMLSEALGSMQEAADSILYSYRNSFNGFAAVLSKNQAETIRGMDGVVSVFKSQTLQLHTTATWEILGLSATDPDGIWVETGFGNDTIIGMIDTGIWPESESFNDDGFGPIPSRWNGTCVSGEKFDPTSNCNKKLIGAKFYYKGFEAMYGNITAPDYKSPRDSAGHGTHTSSTVAGARVANASFLGLANGTSSGGAPSARLAMYKVCWTSFGICTDADLLAAFDDAVVDGVDILSISLGGSGGSEYRLDSIAIGTFHAIEKGVFVSCSAGNSGPTVGTATNIAPWIFTVGASTIHREFQTTLQFGSGDNSLNSNVTGFSLNTYESGIPEQLVYAGHIPAGNTSQDPTACYYGTLDPVKTKGNYILCMGAYYGIDETMLSYGAKGLVAINSEFGEEQSVQFNSVLPIAFLDIAKGDALLQYINNTQNPMAIMDKSTTVFNISEETIMAPFSSVGPNTITMDMLKPDVTAPGVNILASWSPVASPSEEPRDGRTVNFNIISGTSMACPHAAGTAALVKSRHPDWSPAAIKSAIMTTATPLNTAIPGNYELASGAGQINPAIASDPGLVFDLTTVDYINFLCSQGYNSTTVDLISGGKQSCPKTNITVLDLNYPSIYMSSNVTVGQVHNITRTVTNVGPSSGNVTYSVTVIPVNNTDIQVIPSSLNFTAINEQQSFSVIATITNSITSFQFGSITWSDGTHFVRMPIGVGPKPMEVGFGVASKQ